MSKAACTGNRAHGVVDAPAAEPALCEHLGAVLGTEQMVERDAHRCR
jgi:hypothetical protein